jgi:hypothetical protein
VCVCCREREIEKDRKEVRDRERHTDREKGRDLPQLPVRVP